MKKSAFRATKVDVEVDAAAHVSALPLGGGMADGIHGKIPVPGPGTAELLKGFPVYRCFVGTASPETPGRETAVQLETTIDDMSPQLYDPLMDRFLEAGALDVFLTPVIVKRSRPGIVLTALVAPSRVGDLSTVLCEESTTIRVRWAEYQRARLERGLVTLPTAYGPVSFKPPGSRGSSSR